MKPLCVDLFTGLHGWLEAFLLEGYRCVGYDIADMCKECGIPRPEGIELILRDVRSIHGSELKHAAVIVASPPCQAYSYRAMPWKRAKALPPPDNTLFNECFRIQREASEAAGHYIPLIVENVRGAQKWVGRARWNYGSFYLWGDVPALMPLTFKGFKTSGMNWSDQTKRGQDFTRIAGRQALEAIGVKGIPHRTAGHWTNPAEHEGTKEGGDWWNKECRKTGMARFGSKSNARKRASAMIAKIPFPLAVHIARTFKPASLEAVA